MIKVMNESEDRKPIVKFDEAKVVDKTKAGNTPAIEIPVDGGYFYPVLIELWGGVAWSWSILVRNGVWISHNAGKYDFTEEDPSLQYAHQLDRKKFIKTMTDMINPKYLQKYAEACIEKEFAENGYAVEMTGTLDKNLFKKLAVKMADYNKMK